MIYQITLGVRPVMIMLLDPFGLTFHVPRISALEDVVTTSCASILKGCFKRECFSLMCIVRKISGLESLKDCH
jgi:hypothetical protein